LLCRIIGKAGWNGGMSRETITQMVTACPNVSYRMAQYALRLLVAANLVEQVLNQEGTKRLGWKPRKPKAWLSPDELPDVRAQIYSCREQPKAAPTTNVIPMSVVANAGNGNAIGVPRPELLMITDEMMTRIESECPLAATAIFAEKLHFFNYYKEARRNKATGEFEPPLKTVRQWQDSFMSWMERKQKNLTETLERTGKINGKATANGKGGRVDFRKSAGKYSGQDGASAISFARKRTI